MILDFNSKEKIVGIFMITVFILLMSMVVLIGRGKDWFRENVIYYTTFEESYNLQTNASVKQYNADIGRVKEISLEGDRVKVTLAIFEEYAPRIRKDSVASVESVNYIGNKYISIKSGSTDSPPLEEEGTLPSVAKKSLTEILEEFEVEKTAKMVIKAIQNVAELTHSLKNPEGPLFTVLENVNNALSQLELRIATILDNVETITGNIPNTLQIVDNDLKKVDEIGNGILENISQLKEILQNVQEGSVHVPPITRNTRQGIAEIRSGVENIDDVVKSIKKNVLIRSNLPPEPDAGALDAGLRN